MRVFDGSKVITTLESVFTTSTSPYAAFENRPFHGFIYKTEGASHYYFKGKVVELFRQAVPARLLYDSDQNMTGKTPTAWRHDATSTSSGMK